MVWLEVRLLDELCLGPWLGLGLGLGLRLVVLWSRKSWDMVRPLEHCLG